MKLKKGTKMVFAVPSELRFGIKVMGEVVGYAKDVKKKWPEKFANLKNNEEVYLVKRNIPARDEVRYYAVIQIPYCEYL